MSGHLLSWPEGLALETLTALLGAGATPSGESLASAPALGTVSPTLAYVMADRIARRCLQELVVRGGGREHSVLRDGLRASGRIYDEALLGDFDFRFTECSRKLAEVIALDLIGASIHWQQRQRTSAPSAVSPRNHRKMAREWLLTANTAPGDWLFLALVEANLPKIPLPPDLAAEIVSRIHSASPLAWLLSLAGAADMPAALSRCRPLLRPEAVRLLECTVDLQHERLAGALGALWRTQISPPPSSNTEPSLPLLQRWSAVGRQLSGLVAALEEHRRLDLARPLMSALAGLAEELPDQPKLQMQRRVATRSAQALSALCEGIASALDALTPLLQARDRMRAERYGDDRYEEAQLFFAAFDALLLPAVPKLQASVRSLRGVVG